jgi:hypothetical protein
LEEILGLFARLTATSLVAAAAALTLAGGSAVAQTCFTMQAELSHLLGQGQGGIGDRARYERAYREQANVIARTERRARSAGCFGGGGFFLFQRSPSRECNTLMPKLREMQDNLARLDQLRRSAGNDNAYRIRELRQMMRARGCEEDNNRGLFASPSPGQVWEDNRLYSSSGTYRSLCVRTCDGYYFPISFSTRGDQLTTDAQTCQAMCPGAEAELFYYPNPGGGPETMVSLTGTLYSSLPTAFQYRESFHPECSCHPSGYSTAATEAETGPPVGAVEVRDLTPPLPRPRPEPGTDPETLANRAGDLYPGREAEEGPAPDTLVTGPDGTAVRVVGPAYWGASEFDDLVVAPVPN